MWSMKTTDSAFTGELRRVEVGSRSSKDYMKIEYADGSNLYVPATQLDVIQKYADADAAKAPKLNKLGTQEWNRTKTQGARRRCVRSQKDLVELYAARQTERRVSVR